MTLTFTTGVATDVGRVRDGNEDGYLVEPPLYAVADGMGGRRAGEVASALALETLSKKQKKGFVEAVREANSAVYKKQERDASLAGMGTTLTAFVADAESGRLRLAHVGDSRAYVLRGDELQQITDDHTLVNDLVKQGRLERDKAMHHPQRSILTRALGTEPQVEVDEPRFTAEPGDRLLLCSDGLNAMLPDSEIARVLAGKKDASSPQKVAEELVKAANKAGGLDNTTVVVVDVGDSEGATGTKEQSEEKSQAPHAKPKRRLFSRSHNTPGDQEMP